MERSKYELHPSYDAEFPLKFHLDIKRPRKPYRPHWHEHIEMLYIKTGQCTVSAGDVVSTLLPGDVILFSPDCPHDIGADRNSSYYCITVDKSFCDRFGIPANHGQFATVYRSGIPCNCFARIVSLMATMPPCYREEVKALCMQIIAVIYRDEDIAHTKKKISNKMVSSAIKYINAHFAEHITVEEISEHVGFSRHYLCHKFKEVTGKTIIDYINLIRCRNARRLIKSGQYNVSESAYLSGFNNLSNFSKTYKKHMGHSPSDEKE